MKQSYSGSDLMQINRLDLASYTLMDPIVLDALGDAQRRGVAVRTARCSTISSITTNCGGRTGARAAIEPANHRQLVRRACART